MRWTVEKEQFASRPDVKRWSESLSIPGRAKEKRPTFEDVQSARNWCRCASITPSSAVRVSAKCHFAGLWSASFKLLTSTKLTSRIWRGKIYYSSAYNSSLTCLVLAWSQFLNLWFLQSLPCNVRQHLCRTSCLVRFHLHHRNRHQKDWDSMSIRFWLTRVSMRWKMHNRRKTPKSCKINSINELLPVTSRPHAKVIRSSEKLHFIKKKKRKILSVQRLRFLERE